ncbi:family 43 glycosylhydrolase [Nocardioides caldifontis]|uniref:family 43 glycosylhydrolase n=1 Tax=Nocardioides caldifontis TaxID=2588938 RepID=UPI0011E06D3A|nr:family 43 glycosylhydrolase [Nocardioides caldifontis]
MARATTAGVVAALVLALAPTTAPSAAVVAQAPPPTKHQVGADRYRNPLLPVVRGGGRVESCADPSVLRGRGKHRDRWYMLCTTDPLNDRETSRPGSPPFHPIPMLVSKDLVRWRYVGDALPRLPSWAERDAGLWAPDLAYSRATKRYYLTFTVTNTRRSVSGVGGCDGDSAIGVATSRTPTGPWRISPEPVVAPRQNGPGCDFFWTFDPDLLGESVGRRTVLYYGSYYGGVFGQRVALTRKGIRTTGAAQQITTGQEEAPLVEPQRSGVMTLGRTLAERRALQQAVAIPNRYEGSHVVRRKGWYYYFGSATNCCNGPLTGYSVFAGRSRSPLGPFVDREGNSLRAARVGGTPVLSMNGNRWVGLGHNSVFQDRRGQWWTAYHAVDRDDPWFKGERGFTKRPVLLDPVTWRGGWPSVRAGRWASDTVMPAPAAQPRERSRYRADPVEPHRLGAELPAFGDAFDGSALSDAWSWVREPDDPATHEVSGGRFRLDVQTADLHADSESLASVLTRPAPRRDFVVETQVALEVPPEGCCQNFAQAGLVLYAGPQRYAKLVHVSIFETRQTEWAKAVPRGLTRYGNTVVGAPGDETWLRVVKQSRRGRVLLTAYTSQDGVRWVRGGTWRHDRLAGDRLRIGLVSMGAEDPMDAPAFFDHVRVWALAR